MEGGSMPGRTEPNTLRPATRQDAPAGLRIMVVEDDPDAAMSEEILLRLWGHDVVVAPDGPTALEIARDGDLDVVILDIGLPGLNGWKVAELLPRLATEKRPFIIAVTGFGRADDLRQSSEAGVDLHLVKPVNPSDLEAVLRRFQRAIR